MNELYPLKFHPIFKERIWGGRKLHTLLNKPLPENRVIGESWELSGVQENISVVKNGFLKGNDLQELIEVYLGDLVGDHVYDRFGIEFPLLFKFNDAQQFLSIQVHPDDHLAKQRHKAWGKTEMWYIVQADPGAELISGFINGVDEEVYQKALKEKRIPEICNYEPAEEGDLFYIPSGRIHATGAGILFAEIQQTSDVTYRIFDWNRKDAAGRERELHTDLATEAIDFKPYKDYRTP